MSFWKSFGNFIIDVVDLAEEATEVYNEAYHTACKWGIDKICNELDKTSQLSKLAGYRSCLKEKILHFSDEEIIFLIVCYKFQENKRAASTLASILKERNYKK